MKQPRRRVSAGLVATLLGALVCVALPTWPRRAESWVQGVLCVPLRAFSVPAAAAGDAEVGVPAILPGREHDAALADSQGLAGLGLRPIVCTVVDRDNPGAARLPTSLSLGHSIEQLAGCETLVTHGGRLLGYLDADGGPPAARARVALLHARDDYEVRRLPAQVVLENGEILRFLIEPANPIDALPLRCTFLEDPYLASRLRGSGLDVRVAAGGPGDLAVGLRVGRLRVWGYRAGAATIPVGLFIEPDLDPRAISRVVVWHRERRQPVSTIGVDSAVRRQTVGLLRLPAPPPDYSRWFLRSAAAVTLPIGAAVLSKDRLVGIVSRAGKGYGLATPFGERQRVWALVLLPNDPDAPVQYLAARGVQREGGIVRLQRVSGGPALIPGLLFTGSNGPDCPPGLPIGPVRPVIGDADGLLVSPAETAAVLSVVVSGTGP